jgi:hypothetical protein
MAENEQGNQGNDNQQAPDPAALAAEVAQLKEQLTAAQAGGAAAIEAYAGTLRARPGVVPELIIGSTIDELNASLTRASEAFNRVAAVAAAGSGVQAGGGQRTVTPQLPANATAFETLAFAAEHGATGRRNSR